MWGPEADLNQLGAAILLVVVILALRWRMIRNWGRRLLRRRWPRTPPPSAPFVLEQYGVIDGDTLRDNLTSNIYRLENIDCPETEDRAKCYRERKRGEEAKWEAITILKGANRIDVRPTGKIDRYKRRVAFVNVDGQDFGELMIARGFARRWAGRREKWCGPDGAWHF
jgi:endonuclease YncB( thermonuclease family)